MFNHLNIKQTLSGLFEFTQRKPEADASLRDAWNGVLQRGSSSVQPAYGAFSFLRNAEVSRGLQPLRGLVFEPEFPAEELPLEPAFHHINMNTLARLRHMMGESALSKSPSQVNAWAEKLHRFVEVRFPDLRARATQQAGTLAGARLLLTHLAVFLADVHAAGGDLRYLNSALKLRDLGWLKTDEYSVGLTGHKEALLLAQLQLRLHLMAARALSELE